MKFVWKEEYSVGVNEIDDQHKKFFNIIDELDKIIATSDGREKAVRVLTDLASYANYHFSIEEKYFEEFGYEGAQVHTRMHNGYEKKLEDFIVRLQKDDSKLAKDIAIFSKDWLINHILKEDKKYSEIFIEHGLAQ